ncbi:MAG: ThiF family adenylyltransferase, partial [Symbiobacteriaceae bacterium]|nr:ThiF family adenylyltransferase [Symbiobacteriaceae bacterium]
MSLRDAALELHASAKGKIAVVSKVPVNNRDDLNLAYTPGVAEPCKEIHENPALAYTYTAKSNLVAVVSDGSAVLGLGNIGALAALPVMEGKSILFKQFANVDAVPLVLATQDTEEIIAAVCAVAPTFGGINLEDIAAPRCFEIESRLIELLDIPVFHDDQHGTAVVVLAALLNAVKVVAKKLADCTIVISGVGAAGCATAKLLLGAGVKEILMVDRQGIISRDLPQGNPAKKEMAQLTNSACRHGDLKEALRGADVFIGLSGASIADRGHIGVMNSQAIVFAMANPIP